MNVQTMLQLVFYLTLVVCQALLARRRMQVAYSRAVGETYDPRP